MGTASSSTATFGNPRFSADLAQGHDAAPPPPSPPPQTLTIPSPAHPLRAPAPCLRRVQIRHVLHAHPRPPHDHPLYDLSAPNVCPNTVSPSSALVPRRVSPLPQAPAGGHGLRAA
ncbi:hypothetical protein JB92DRAFT_3103969 [Gautieria morchelliformis]|nr:hypothetical protein JB92DRAFT_3103969 [Gautieria morchelliformis]